MTDTQGLILFIATALGGLAIVGPDDYADAVRTEQMRAEYQAQRPVLIGEELRGCAPDLLRRDDGRIVQDCLRWAIYSDGREVLTGIVKKTVEPGAQPGVSTARRSGTPGRAGGLP